MDALVKILELLKQPVRYIVGIACVTAAILFSPDSLVDKLGLLKIRQQWKPYFGAALAGCAAIIIANLIGYAVTRYRQDASLRAARKRLHHLTADEKEILRQYVHGQTRTAYLSVQDGTVTGLTHEDIIYRSAQLSVPRVGVAAFAHNIQPWAWEYLNEHPELLD